MVDQKLLKAMVGESRKVSNKPQNLTAELVRLPIPTLAKGKVQLGGKNVFFSKMEDKKNGRHRFV